MSGEKLTRAARIALRALRGEVSPAIAEHALNDALPDELDAHYSCLERAKDKPLPISPERANDLWHVAKTFDKGPEGNLKAWTLAATLLEQFVEAGDVLGNDATVHALVDARWRAEEEVKRAQVEVTMRREWAAKQPKEADLL